MMGNDIRNELKVNESNDRIGERSNQNSRNAALLNNLNKNISLGLIEVNDDYFIKNPKIEQLKRLNNLNKLSERNL